MPWRDVPSFYKRLTDVGTVDTRALQLTILTGARTDEVIGKKEQGDWAKYPATWAEIGEEDGKPVWIIAAERMKATRKHVVPLTPQMVALLGKPCADHVPLFDVSSQNAMLNTLKATDGGIRFTVHGFRSSFEDWARRRPASARPDQALHRSRQTDEDRSRLSALSVAGEAPRDHDALVRLRDLVVREDTHGFSSTMMNK